MDMLTTITEKVKNIFSSDTLNAFAKETKFIQRKRKITAQDFLFHHLTLVSDKECSLTDVAEEFFESKQIDVTKQAIHKKYKEHATHFIQKVLAALMDFTVETQIPLKAIPFVQRVMTVDSSGFKLNQEFAEMFPGSRNQKAGLKLQTMMNVVTNKLYSLDVRRAQENDQSYIQYMEHIKPQDLSINDLGYFRVASFKEIQEKGAFFLSRFLKSTAVYCLDKTKFDLETHLQKTKENKVDRTILLGAAKLSCRIVALRLPPDAYQQRLKNLAEKNRKRGKKNQANSSTLDEWTILITNLPSSVTPDTLLMLYGLRWQIELFFKVIKAILKLRDISSHQNMHKTLIYFYSSLVTAILLTLCSITIVNEEISLYKAAKYFVKHMKKFITQCMSENSSISSFIERIKRVAIKESTPKRPTAKQALGASYA